MICQPSVPHLQLTDDLSALSSVPTADRWFVSPQFRTYSWQMICQPSVPHLQLTDDLSALSSAPTVDKWFVSSRCGTEGILKSASALPNCRRVSNLCFTPSRPVRLYQGDQLREKENKRQTDRQTDRKTETDKRVIISWLELEPSQPPRVISWRQTREKQEDTIQYNFIAKCQYTDCTRNVLSVVPSALIVTDSLQSYNI